jgi:hypothetical protein
LYRKAGQVLSLEDALIIDENATGCLEWVSGLIFVNSTRAEWEAFSPGHDNPFDFDRGQLKRTIVHETFHFYQIATTGYLYRFVVQLFGLLQEWMGEGASRDERLKAVGEGQPISAPHGFEAVLACLDAPGPRGLTVRGIVESAAYLYEFRAEYPTFGPKAYVEQLAVEDPGMEYRVGYDLAASVLGGAAFDALLPVALIALCFEDPPRAFVTALETIANSSRSRPVPDTLAGIRWLASSLPDDMPRLGSAAEVALDSSGRVQAQHPIYLEAVLHLNGDRIPGGPLLFMVDPARMLASLDQLMRPMCLRERAIWLPESQRAESKASGITDRLQAVRMIAALSSRLQHAVFLPRPRPRRTASDVLNRSIRP